MKPPGKTSLFQMQRAALLEAERIEISQDARISAGLMHEPMPRQVEARDAFAGIVRLIDAIWSDQALLERLKERMAAMPGHDVAPRHVIDAGDDIAIDAEAE